MLDEGCDKSGIQENMIVLRQIQSVPLVPKLMECLARGVE